MMLRMLPWIPLFFFHSYHVSWQHFKIASTLGIKKCILNIIQIMVLLYHSIGYMSRKILITKLTSLVFRLTILKRRLKIFLCWLFNLLDQHTFCQDQWWVKPYICVTKKETKGRRPCAKNTKSELPWLHMTSLNVRFLWTLLAKIRKRVFT